MASPVLRDGKLLVGAGMSFHVIPPNKNGFGVMLCLNASDGKLLWQAAHPMLPERVHDMVGACSKPVVEGDRVYYQSNRGELMCVDLQGFANGNDGPYRSETQTGPTDADIVWKLDMVERLGVFKRDAADVGSPIASPLVVGDRVFMVSGNGTDNDRHVPKPEAPSFLAADKRTGEVLWTSSAPGDEICEGQWASPVAATVEGRQIVIFPGGDGCLYGFEQEGKPLWRVDCNGPAGPSSTALPVGQAPAVDKMRRGYCVATPVVAGTMLYAGLHRGIEWESGSDWPLVAVDLAGCAANEGVIKWKFSNDRFRGTLGSVAVDGELLYVFSAYGYLIALERSTGKEIWFNDLVSGPGYFTSPLVDRGRLFIGDEDGNLRVFATGRTGRRLGRFENVGRLTGAPFVAGDTLYVNTVGALLALRMPKEIDAIAPAAGAATP